jgi:hypothetical protein
MPWNAEDGNNPHQWVEMSEANPGILGLGLESGLTPGLELSHISYVSAAATKCRHTTKTLEQLLLPIAARQRDLNQRRISMEESEARVGEFADSKLSSSTLPIPTAVVLNWPAYDKHRKSSLSLLGGVANSDSVRGFFDSDMQLDSLTSDSESDDKPSASSSTSKAPASARPPVHDQVIQTL